LFKTFNRFAPFNPLIRSFSGSAQVKPIKEESLLHVNWSTWSGSWRSRIGRQRKPEHIDGAGGQLDNMDRFRRNRHETIPVSWGEHKPPHPAAARLFVDFLLSREGQQLYQSAGRLVARSDMPQDESAKVRGARIVPVDPAWAENFDEDSKLLKEIFSKWQCYQGELLSWKSCLDELPVLRGGLKANGSTIPIVASARTVIVAATQFRN